MAVSARLTPLEQVLLDALCLGTSQADVIREGIRLVWEQRGAAAMFALGVLHPERLERLSELAIDYGYDDPVWRATLDGVAEQYDAFEPPKRGRRKSKPETAEG